MSVTNRSIYCEMHMTAVEYKPFLSKCVFTFVRARSLSRVQRRDAALSSLLP